MPFNKFFYSLCFLAFSSLLTACFGNQEFDCAKSTGDIITQEIPVDPFISLKVNENINVYLTQGQEQSVTIKAGENLIPKITFEVTNGRLVIGNENTCNWIRDNEEIKVFINTPKLSLIIQNGHGVIKSIGTFSVVSLSLDAHSPGDINLDLNIENLIVNSYSLSNISCSGRTKNATINFHRQDGQFQGENLKIQNVKIRHKGSNIIKVYPIENLEGQIDHNGDIHYYHKPYRMNVVIKENGKLIDKTKG